MRKRPVRNDEIDLLELVRVLWHRAWILAIAFVIGAVTFALGTITFITPTYTASSTIYILSRDSELSALADLQVGNLMVQDFQIIAKTREVMNIVIDDLGLEMTTGQLSSKVYVSNPEDSHMLRISVVDTNPQRAADISNDLANVLREQIAEIMDTDKPSSVEKAVVPKQKSGPSTKKNTLMGGMFFAMIVAAIFIMRHLMDDTIKDEDDVEKYLGLKVLAAIPAEQALTDKGRLSKIKKTRKTHG
ncbi:MAG: polysaccharide export protein [Lachnospiraceae bacterium]|nr:polysaccharide export protein [Candidatus Equihabitans merdae]